VVLVLRDRVTASGRSRDAPSHSPTSVAAGSPYGPLIVSVTGRLLVVNIIEEHSLCRVLLTILCAAFFASVANWALQLRRTCSRVRPDNR